MRRKGLPRLFIHGVRAADDTLTITTLFKEEKTMTKTEKERQVEAICVIEEYLEEEGIRPSFLLTDRIIPLA